MLFRRRDQGFTLIELLVVLVMIMVLARIAVPVVVSFRQRAFDGLAMKNLRDGLTAEEAYYTKSEAYVSCIGADCVQSLPSFHLENTVHLGFRIEQSNEGETVVGVSCSSKGSEGGKFFFRVDRVISGQQFSTFVAADSCSDEAIEAMLTDG